MSISELHTTIQSEIESHPAQLMLDGELVASQAVGDMLTSYLGLDRIGIDAPVLHPAQIDPGDTAFTVTGTLNEDAFSLSGSVIEARFFFAGDEAQVIISLHLPADWKFTDTFPSLVESIFPQNPDSETSLFVFDDLNLSEGRLIVASVGEDAGSLEHWARGLSFEATLDGRDSEALAFGRFLLTESVTLSGPIDISGEIPVVSLEAAVSEATSFGYLAGFPVKLQIATQEREAGADGATAIFALIRFYGALVLGEGSGSVTVPIGVEAAYGGVALEFVAELDQIPVAGLSLFDNLFNGLDFSSVIPEEFQTESGLRLSSLTISVNAADLSIESISVWLTVRLGWDVVSGALSAVPLEATDLRLNFSITNPGDADTRVLAFGVLTSIAEWTVIEEIVDLRDLEALILVSKTPEETATSGYLKGDILLGSSVNLSTYFPIPLDSGRVQLESSEIIELPDLETLSNLIGGGDFAALLPPGLAELSRFSILYANLELQLKPLSFELLQIQMATRDEWRLLDGVAVRDVVLSLAVQSPAGGSGETSVAVDGVIAFGSTDPVDLLLRGEYLGQGMGVLLSGATSAGQAIPIGDLISDLADRFGSIELPAVISSLEITRLQVSFNTATRDFHFACSTQLTFDDQTADLALNISIVNTSAGFDKNFSGVLTLCDRELAVRFSSDSISSSLVASFENPDGEPIHLINDVLGLITQDPGLQVDDEYNLLEFTLYHLELSFEKNKTTGAKSYGVVGDFGWEPNLSIGGSDPVAIRAAVDLSKPSGGRLTGSISGNVQTPIPDLEFLELGVFYQFSNTASSVGLRIRLGEVLLEAAYSSTSSQLAFSVVTTTPLTFGEVMTFFAGLVNPSIETFEFDPPWNSFTEIEIPISDFQLTFNTSTKAIGMVYVPSSAFTIPGLPESLLSISRVELAYGIQSQTRVKKLEICLDATFLGVTFSKADEDPLRWDPINDAPPEVPGKGASVFDLRYLGLGQHVAFTQAAQVTSISEVMGLLRGSITESTQAIAADGAASQRNPLESFGEAGVIAFSPESEWLIGLDVTLLKTLSLSVIFNDPVIYGLRIELTGEHAKNFAGLEFEILYTRISDTIGKYHIDLTLPDFVRYLQFGAVSVTLPCLTLDIFTNGDFKVDLGFPWNFNFERSFALEVLPFTGAGGFYFNKLSAATASSTPVIPATRGEFTPVYEFGLGLRIGLGKSFHSGPLSAEISITVEGVIEGVISWYNPVDTAQDRELYYKIAGGVAIVGRLYGEVDFGIVSASLEVVARAMIQFVLETYKDIPILLEASVSVRASVKVAFVRIHFSFSMTVRQEFVIDSPNGYDAPWGPSLPAAAFALRGFARSQGSAPDFSQSITLWLAEEARRQDVFFQPALTWHGGAVQGVALLMLEYDSTSGSDKQDFRELVKGLVRWAWEAAGNGATDAVTLPDLSALFDALATASLSYEQLNGFLSRHYDFHVQSFPAPAPASEVEATVFPMFPHLELVVGNQDGVSFSPPNRNLSPEDVSNLRDYFRQLQAQFEATPKTNTIEAASIAEFIFVGYARLLMRTGLQAAIDVLEAGSGRADNIAALVDAVSDPAYLNIAQMASRFLLQGFNLPEEVFGGEVADADEGLYVSTRQQYPFEDSRDAAADAYEVTLRMGVTPEAHIHFPGTDGDDRPAITHAIARDAEDTLLLDQATALASVTTKERGDLPSARPSRMPTHRDERHHFALRHRVRWSAGETRYLLPLSASLRDHLRSRDPNPVVDLVVWQGGKPSDAVDVPNAEFAWATRIDLAVVQIPDPATGEALPKTFELDGGSEEHKKLLEGVWSFLTARDDPDAVELTLLYVADAGTTSPGVATLAAPGDDVLLIKANLSNDTGNVGPQTFSAAFSAKQRFLEVLWEGLDVSGGGYYFHLPGLDGAVASEIFGGDGRGVIQLLIALTDNADPIHDFNNCALFDEALDGGIDPEADLILARSEVTVPVLTVPAGFLGFQIDDRAEIPDDPDSGLDELGALYHLLGYQVQEHEGFIESHVGLPIGPTEVPPGDGSPPGRSLYERLVPAFSLASGAPPTGTPHGGGPLPAAELDPYRGVAATLRLDTWWQDVYGNQLLSGKTTTDFPVRYSDPLIGVHQWPSVAESYAFESDATGARRLSLGLTFDASSYFEDGDPSRPRVDRMAGDKATIQRAYYQLIQDDVDLALRTSLDEDWISSEVDKAGLIAFLAEIHRFLDRSKAEAPEPFEQRVDASGMEPKAAFIFEVGVELTMSRDLDRVLDDLKVGGAIQEPYRNVLESSATLSPRHEASTETGNTDSTLTIRPFARSFQAAFAGLRLAISQDRASSGQPGAAQRPLYAVRLDSGGLEFEIASAMPVYFALPPLSSSLLAGQVPLDDYAGWKGGIAADAELDDVDYDAETESQQFDALDVNVLARDFLVAVEKFLDPGSLIPARRLSPSRDQGGETPLPGKAESILARKAELAAAISEDVSPVLARDVPTGGTKTEAESQAEAALRQQLLVDLVAGYDVETIVQYGVSVTVSNDLEPLPWTPGNEPRVRGKVNVLGAQVGEGGNLETIPLRELDQALDFSISAGKIRLSAQGGDPSSFFTYLFDTKKPELFASVVLDLELVPTEIEYDVTRLAGIADHEASSWLAFVLPDGLRQPIGAYPIPIPLRNYPQPPSLIQQGADADPTSRSELADVRQWQYTLVYEHPDVSQDSVDCILQLNVPEIDNLPTASGTIEPPSGLFQSLVNFSHVYPQLTQDLDGLRDPAVLSDDAKSRRARIALIAFEALVHRVTNDWRAWTTGVDVYAPGEGDLHLEVSEEAGATPDQRQGWVQVVKAVASKVGGDSILPILQLPGYDQSGTTQLNGEDLREDSVIVDGDRLLYPFKRDKGDLTFFGDSSIPDRKLLVENLDVIEHQNAWASVWLSRNKHLLEENGDLVPTNPAFVFQTPAVRFNNRVTPFITNDEPWEIATLSPRGDPGGETSESAEGEPVSRTLEEHLQALIDLLFPVVEDSRYEVRLSCRYAFALARGRGVNEDLLTTLPILLGLRVRPAALAAGYAEDLATELGGWLAAKRPSVEAASFLFVVDLFSKLDEDSATSLPMLRITRLGLALEHVSDLDALIA